MLTPTQLDEYHRNGHVTVPHVFSEQEMQLAIEDTQQWSETFRRQMEDDEKRWYLESSAAESPLRKLDDPAFHREAFRRIAQNRLLVDMVEQLIGKGVHVVFSQIFLKPPEVGGPKPIHQDNFYFGAKQPESILTAWIALDDARTGNGCLYYGNGSHLGRLFNHVAPEDQPFNLSVPPDLVKHQPMTAAPVDRGGVSFHHGHTLHQSSSNTSQDWRRAVAFHYLRNDVELVTPALDYDSAKIVRITDDVQ